MRGHGTRMAHGKAPPGTRWRGAECAARMPRTALPGPSFCSLIFPPVRRGEPHRHFRIGDPASAVCATIPVQKRELNHSLVALSQEFGQKKSPVRFLRTGDVCVLPAPCLASLGASWPKDPDAVTPCLNAMLRRAPAVQPAVCNDRSSLGIHRSARGVHGSDVDIGMRLERFENGMGTRRSFVRTHALRDLPWRAIRPPPPPCFRGVKATKLKRDAHHQFGY